MINWDKLIAECRLGLEDRNVQEADDIRSTFQRDYDRIIFSSPFRRLQDKTQVFPLPGSIFVHNRLTHSLEVASVGRSLGNLIAATLNENKDHKYQNIIAEIGTIVSAACLAHDLGNPPFGHSGESAIADFFKRGGGLKYQNSVTEAQWTDLTCFEGNANAFRVLSHQFSGKRNGGFALTYSTLASVVKYPFESVLSGGKPKFGFFQSEKQLFRKIASQLELIKISDEPLHFMRHPFVYLVEAADDICYQIMDIEDAHKLKILTSEETKSLFLSFFDEERKARRMETMNIVTDINEQISYLRSSVIGQLIDQCSAVFAENEQSILDGTFTLSLIKQLPQQSADAYKSCEKMALAKIYRSSEVLDIELAGYKIILTLLENLVKAVLNPEKAYSQQLLMRIPEQYETDSPTVYGKIMAVLDYISGMTDIYALDLYRKITGMSIPTL